MQRTDDDAVDMAKDATGLRNLLAVVGATRYPKITSHTLQMNSPEQFLYHNEMTIYTMLNILTLLFRMLALLMG